MRIYSKKVDLRNRTEMTAFLKNHFRYHTMNSWNQSTSYANNVKITNLQLDRDVESKLYDLLSADGAYDGVNDLIRHFDEKYNYIWQVGFNGRSGGYLVLYQGEKKPSEYKSYCVYCGQRNYRTVDETGNKCGRCGEYGRENYDTPPFLISSFPGRSTDMYEDFEDWSMVQLRDRVRLVQEFDQLTDDIVSEAVSLAKNYVVEEEEYFIPQTRKVLREVECA